MIFYLTVNDSPSGIYSSQVIDVVKFLNKELNAQVRLIAFISFRRFLLNRKKIKEELSDAIILPMWPKLQNWKRNKLLLRYYVNKLKADRIIGRSILATQLALNVQKNKPGLRVIYDGRGAITAEWKEYAVVTNKKLISEIGVLEKEAILNSNYRIAVSEQLVKLWREDYGYNADKHVIIPCTLNKIFENLIITPKTIQESKQMLGLHKEDIIFVYAGSIAGWQSFDLLYDFIGPVLNSFPDSKLLFLSDSDQNIAKLMQEFPGRVICKKTSPVSVPSYLLAADYGLLIRQESITNKVASPVKFAEYLACGLKVIISDHLGDYTEFVKKNNCGHFYKDFRMPVGITLNEKLQIRETALAGFTKTGFKAQYRQVIN